jgi:hypothetical protein
MLAFSANCSLLRKDFVEGNYCNGDFVLMTDFMVDKYWLWNQFAGTVVVVVV